MPPAAPAALTVRTAVAADADDVAALVGSAYRGEASRAGWTSEADLLDDERVDAAGVAEKIAADEHLVLLGHDGDGVLVACCELERRGPALAYFGLFAVSPARQAGGVGRQLLAAAEATARERWGARVLEMTVIAQRTELIAWYERRGYSPTGESRPFPYEQTGGRALRDDLSFVVLAKAL